MLASGASPDVSPTSSAPQPGQPSPWEVSEAELAQARATYESYVVSQEEGYAQTVGDQDISYAQTDHDAFLAQAKTLIGDDLSAAVGGTGGTSAADAMALFDDKLAGALTGDERGFELTVSPDAQGYQDTLATDAHDYQWAVAQANHDVANGAIDGATAASQIATAATTQSTNDTAAAALYQSQVGGATVTQLQEDADATLNDATERKGEKRERKGVGSLC